MDDYSFKVKEKIMRWLKQLEIGNSLPGDQQLGSVKQMRLYTINGLELHDNDNLNTIHDDDYIYYSFSKRQPSDLII